MKTNNNSTIFGHDKKTNHAHLNNNAFRSKKVILTLGYYSKELHGEAFIQIAGKLIPIEIINPDFSVIIDGVEYNTNINTRVYLKHQ